MSTQQKSHKISVSLLLLLVLIVTVFTIYYGIGKHQQKINPQKIQVNGSYLVPPKEIMNFYLTTHEGKTIQKESLKNHWSMIFFGFTNCGVVCPTTLAALNKMYQTLQKELPENKLPQIMLVTVDPERDTVSRLKSYVTAFNPQFIGATGNPSDLVSLQKQFHILAIKMQGDTQEKDNYFYDHSAEILVINPNAEVQAYLSYPHKPEQLVKDYKLILATADI